jgi:hypothetical protein
MANISFKDSNDSSSPSSSNSMRNKMNNNISLNKTNQYYMKRNAFKKSSSLLIFHQNIRGINNKIEELLSQWESRLPHVFYFTEHPLTKPEISRTVIKFYNLGAYFCSKSRKNGGVSSFVHQNVQFTPIDLDEFCIDQEIEICAVKLHHFFTSICTLIVYRLQQEIFNTF